VRFGGFRLAIARADEAVEAAGTPEPARKGPLGRLADAIRGSACGRCVARAWHWLCNDFWFWRIFPWMFVLCAFTMCNLFILFFSLAKYAHDRELFVGWLESFGISLSLGWLLFDPAVIIARNNLAFTKKILKTRKYQVLEKYVLIPFGAAFAHGMGILRKMLC